MRQGRGLAGAAQARQHFGVGRVGRIERVEGLGRDGVLTEGGLLEGDAGEDTDFTDAGVPAVADHQRGRRLELVGQVEIALGRGGGDLQAIEVERLAGAEVDRARELILDQVGRRVLVDVDARQQFGRDVFQVQLVGARGGEDVAAVEFGADLGQAADRDRAAFAILTLDLDAGDALQRFGDVPVGQLANVFGDDRVDDHVAVALDRLGAGKAGADTGDNDAIFGRRSIARLFRSHILGVRLDAVPQHDAGERDTGEQFRTRRHVKILEHLVPSSPLAPGRSTDRFGAAMPRQKHIPLP